MSQSNIPESADKDRLEQQEQLNKLLDLQADFELPPSAFEVEGLSSGFFDMARELIERTPGAHRLWMLDLIFKLEMRERLEHAGEEVESSPDSGADSSPYRNLFLDSLHYEFLRTDFLSAFMNLISMALDSDAKERRRGEAFLDEIFFEILLSSEYRDFESIYSEAIYAAPVKADGESGKFDYRNRWKAAKSLLLIIKDQELLLRLADHLQNDPDDDLRYWGAVNRSMLMPPSKRAWRLLFESLLKQNSWQSSWDIEWELGASGHAIAAFALQALAGRFIQGSGTNHESVLAQALESALSVDPANREAAEQAVKALYSELGLAEPEILWCESYEQLQDERDALEPAPEFCFLRRFSRAHISIANRNCPFLSRWTAAADAGLLPGSWQESVLQMSRLASFENWNRLYSGFHVLQFDCVSLEVLNFAAGYFAEENRLFQRLKEIAANCAGAYFQSKRCQLFERPEKITYDEQYRFHNRSGSCIKFRDGKELFAFRNLPLPAEYVLEPGYLNAARILAQENQELRRVLLSEYGMERFVKESNAKVLSWDKYGTLYEITPLDRVRDENIVVVKVKDPSTGREYFLRVHPDVKTAREAVAWTFALTEEEFNPREES